MTDLLQTDIVRADFNKLLVDARNASDFSLNLQIKKTYLVRFKLDNLKTNLCEKYLGNGKYYIIKDISFLNGINEDERRGNEVLQLPKTSMFKLIKLLEKYDFEYKGEIELEITRINKFDTIFKIIKHTP